MEILRIDDFVKRENPNPEERYRLDLITPSNGRKSFPDSWPCCLPERKCPIIFMKTGSR